MADTYGAVELPIQVPGADDSVSDPLLDVTGAFLKAFINRYGTAAWQAVQPNTFPVQTVRVNDPEELEFNERDLPCLYLWRASSGKAQPPESIAEDIYVMRDQILVFWVLPPARQAFRAFRSQYVAGLAKMIQMAIELGRDPCWISPGDPDSLAARYGSVFPRFAGWIEMNFSNWQSKMMLIPTDKETRKYPSFFATIDVTEMFEFDLDKFDALAGLDQKIYDPTNTLLINERDTT